MRLSKRDGKLGEHIGYAPVFKEGDDLDLKAHREDNVRYYGTGEMGKIMLDFEWNNMMRGKGYGEMAQPVWDKRMWDDDGSWLKAPTLRSVTDMAVSAAVGVATGGLGALVANAAMGLADDAVFALLDGAMGYKGWDEVGVEFGKKVLTTAVTAAAQGVLNGVGTAGMSQSQIAQTGLIAKVSGKAGDLGWLADAGLRAAQAVGVGTVNSLIGSVTYSGGEFGFDGEAFGKGVLSSAAGAAAGAVRTVAGNLLGSLNLGDKLEKVLGFNAGQIGEMQQFNQFAGSLAGAGVSYAMTGEVTLNVLNLGFLAGDGNTALDRILSTGLLEMRLGGEKGFGMSVGSGGTDVSIGTVATAMAGLAHWGKNADIEAAARRDSAENAATAMRGAYGFGDETDLAQLDSILKGETRILAGDAGEGAQTVAAGGTRYVIMNGVNEAVTAEQKLALALTLSHEGRRDGVADGSKAETQGAVLAHTEMAVRMLGDAATGSIMKNVIDGSETLQRDLGAYMTAKLRGDDSVFDRYVDEVYDSSADFWKLVKNASGEYGLAWDGNLNIYGENGNRTDANADLLIGYQDIQDVLDGNKGNAKITLAEGIEVNYSALETVQGINQSIIASGKEQIAGGDESGAKTAKALLDDGFMSETEAIAAAVNVLDRYATSGIGPTMIEHYSARFVFDEMGQAFFDGREIMSDIPAGFGLFKGDGLTGELNDAYHEMGNGWRSDEFLEGNGNDKYVRSYGGETKLSGTTYEVVLTMFGEVVTDPVNRGTFNFNSNSIIDHFFLDVSPYQKWGNDPIDRLTTSFGNRVLGSYRGPIPIGIFK